MDKSDHYNQVKNKIEELERIARELYDSSEDFPALNRNLKRILASVDILKMNIEWS